MNLVIKGFIIGIGKIMPGVSGAMLAITLGEYDKIISSIANIKDETMKKMKYLSKLGIGLIGAIVITSKIIVKCLNDCYLPTMLLFIGIIAGGIPEMTKKIKITKKEIIISIISIFIIILSTKIKFITRNYQLNYSIIDFIKLIGIGIVDAISSIVPGISGTALLMTLGYYNTILETFSTLTDISKISQNAFIILPFFVGFILGTFLISKLINIILKKYNNILNFLVVLFMTVTTFFLTQNTLAQSTNYLELIDGILFLILGFIISIKMSNKNKSKKYT